MPDMNPPLTLRLEGIGAGDQQGAVLSWNWGMHCYDNGDPAREPEVTINELSMSRYSDSLSSHLMRLCATQARVPRVVLSVQDDRNEREAIRLTLEDVRVSSFNIGGSDGGERATESVLLRAVIVKSAIFDQDGEKVGEFSWDTENRRML